MVSRDTPYMVTDTLLKSRMYTSKMHTIHLQTIHASETTTRCHSWGPVQWGPISKFEHVSSDDHKVSLAGGARARLGGYHVSCLGGGQGWELPCLMSGVSGGTGAEPGGGFMYSEVQCIMGNGHMGHPCGQTEWQTHVTENIAFPQLHW